MPDDIQSEIAQLRFDVTMLGLKAIHYLIQDAELVKRASEGQRVHWPSRSAYDLEAARIEARLSELEAKVGP